jgi:hypothetical protein
MERTRYCAFNKSRGTFLSLDVSISDAALEPLKVLKFLIEGLGTEAHTGAWLTNFKAIPVARALSPYDLIYLDKDHRVVHVVALSVDGEFRPFDGAPESALLLPPNSIALSQTGPGDQLIIVEAHKKTPESQLSVEPAPIAKPVPFPEPVPMPETAPQLGPAVSAATPPTSIAETIETGDPLARFLSTQSFTAPVHEPAPAPPPPQPLATPSIETKPAAQPTPPSAPHVPVSKVSEASPVATEREAQLALPLRILEVHPEAITPPALPPAQSAPSPHASGAMLSNVPTHVRSHPAAPQQTLRALRNKPKIESVAKRKSSLGNRFQHWLSADSAPRPDSRPRDRRRATRLDVDDLVAYFFTGGPPHPHKIENVSITGFYMHMDDTWMPGTIIRMTLQKAGTLGDNPGDAITVHSKVVRTDSLGGGFEFVLSGFLDRALNNRTRTQRRLQ